MNSECNHKHWGLLGNREYFSCWVDWMVRACCQLSVTQTRIAVGLEYVDTDAMNAAAIDENGCVAFDVLGLAASQSPAMQNVLSTVQCIYRGR